MITILSYHISYHRGLILVPLYNINNIEVSKNLIVLLCLKNIISTITILTTIR